MSALTLEKMGITDFAGVVNASPSVYFAQYPSAAGTLFLFMRGQGSGDPAQITGDGAVGVYEDGIYLSRPQGISLDLADAERVETLRGPQGTLVRPQHHRWRDQPDHPKPSGEFKFKQDFNFGTRNLFRSLTSIDLPAWGDSIGAHHAAEKFEGWLCQKQRQLP